MSAFYKMMKPLTSQRANLLVCLPVIMIFLNVINLQAQCVNTAYSGNSVTGNQSYTERLGLQFTTSVSIKITHLGAFDDGGDGINLPVTVGIVRNSDATTMVGPEIFIGSGDVLDGSFRMREIIPVYLPAGTYTIVAVGFGMTEQNGNSNIGGFPTVTANGGGMLTFDNSLFGGVGFGLPTTLFPNPGAFHAGTFIFEPTLTAPVITKIPNVTFSCENEKLSIDILTPGTGGGVNCADEYRYSTDNGTNWTSWDITMPSFDGVAGINIIQARRSCDMGNCISDTTFVSWDVNPPVTSLNIEADPTGSICIGATDVKYVAVVTGGGSSLFYSWCAYDNGTGSGTCFGGFSPGNGLDNSVQTRNWVSSTGMKSVRVTISQNGCPEVSSLYSFNVESDPVRPSLLTSSPGTIYACEGTSVSATFNPGSGGAGSCTDEFRVSVDNGSTWSDYVPGSAITMGTQTILIQSRRVCDGFGCDGAGETFATVVSWTSSLLPTPSILPDPAEVCAGVDLELNGNPSGGTGIYTSHSWSGSDAVFLNPTDMQLTTFNNDKNGLSIIQYTVTDSNGCTGTDGITITVYENPIADITPDGFPVICQLTELQLDGNPTGGSGMYTTHSWYNAIDYLDNPDIQNPVFSSPVLGEFEIYYLVIDNNGCIGRDTITIKVDDLDNPKLICPDMVQMDADPDRCTAVVCYPVSATDNCPNTLPTSISGFTFIGTHNGRNYFYSNFATSWEAANVLASSYGANLVSITSQAEQTFLSTFIPNGPASQFWIGLRYSPSLDAFKWTTGEPVVYQNWGIGQPGILDGDYVFHFDAAVPLFMGWYDSPAILNRRFIIEFSDLPEVLSSGLPSGSNFPVGQTLVQYQTVDQKGNTASCEFIVEVLDTQNPVITCPEDIVIELDPLECGRNVDFEVTATDNCELEEIIPDPAVLSGSFFPVGITSLTYTAFDTSGNSASCSFKINLIDYPHPSLGCIPVHLSLDGDCQATLELDNVLTGHKGPGGEILLGCLNCFEVVIKAPNGTPIGNHVDGSYLGKTLDYHVKNTKSGFSCWNTVLIEDKIAPTIECRNDTISCMADLSTAKLPIASDNCNAKVVSLGYKLEKLDCDPIAIARYIRTWKAVDDYGNESESCNDTVYLSRTNLEGLVFPGNEELSCSEGYAVDSKGFPYPSPQVTGVPTLNGQKLYPFDQSLICNGAITYNDQLILNTPCKKRIIRTWSITEWWCSTTVIYNMPFQIIDILDNTPPDIPFVEDITVTTNSRSCDADVILPTLNITDNCTSVKLVIVNATLNGVPSGTVNGNGGLIKLSVGTHRIEYTAIDDCGKTAKMHYFITVKDDTSPLAICDQLNTVSLNSNGYAQISAASVDDGSFDECGPVSLQIQRMEDPCETGQNVGWHDSVSFCCEDAHKTRMVVLLVTDGGGNTNMCMVSVQVQDKIPPVLTCPPHLLRDDCTFTFDPLNADIYFGEASVSDNCPSTVTVRQTLVDQRTNCGIGNVVRTFTGEVNGAVFSTCTQTITFSNNNPFDGYNNDHVIWPKDTTITGSCSPLDLMPESLPSGVGKPIIVEDACDLVGLTHRDEVYYFANNNACWKILRYWTIIDWCQIGSDGKYLTWTHEQEIKVVDNEAPMITSSNADRMVCTYDSQCEGGQMTELIATAMDCTPDSMLQWSYIIYHTDVNPEVFFKAGIGNDVSGYYPIGTYRVVFTVLDRCGNISTTGFNFEMRNCKKPTPVCKQNLSTTLSMMPDGNGGTTPQVMVEASFFDNKSYHPCKYPVAISFSPDTFDIVRTFTCMDTAGLNRLEIWVTDINGNAEYCVSYLDVQDSLNICSSGRVAVQGTIMTDNEVEVESVKVDINNGEGSPSYTNTDGQYIFEDLPTGNSYTFTPKKDGDDKNGISTLDVVMIQRHILGIQKIENPYRLIAADVNNSGNISAADLLELRKLILGVYDELPQSDSWRFVDAMYNFPVPANPWIGLFPEQCALQQVMQDATVNFVAIKVGDVNGSAVGHQFKQDAFESRSAFSMSLEDVRLTPGNTVRVPVSASGDAKIYGLQLMLNNRWSSTLKIIPAAVSVKSHEVFTLSDNKTGLSISIPEGLDVKSGDVLFYIEVESSQNGMASDILSLNPVVRAEIYTEGLTEQNLRFEWRKDALQEFMISGIQPNPWKSQTFIDVIMPDNSMVTLKVKDASGRKVISRVEYLSKGANRIMLTSEELGTAGIYFYELKYEHTVHTGKMIMID